LCGCQAFGVEEGAVSGKAFPPANQPINFLKKPGFSARGLRKILKYYPAQCVV
jgi:hypothetical protein